MENDKQKKSSEHNENIKIIINYNLPDSIVKIIDNEIIIKKNQ